MTAKALKFFRDTTGAALVEFSLLLPMLVVIMGFGSEFGRAVYQIHVAEKGVKNAARYLARVPDIAGCTTSSFDGFALNAINVAQKGSFNNNAPLKLSNWDAPNDITIEVDCVSNLPDAVTNVRPFFGGDQIPIITVRTAFDFNSIGMLDIIQLLDPTQQDNEGIVISAAHKEIYVGD